MSKARYLARLEETRSDLDELNATLADRTEAPQTDMQQLFDLVVRLAAAPPDEEELREIVSGVVDRILVTDRRVEVVWQEAYRPLFTDR
jgi:hypothetical protein